MNKSQLVEALAPRFDGNKKEAQHALESIIDVITRAVAAGDKVAITGFGAFEKIDRPARMVRNPRTGERKRAKKTSVPKFRAGAELKAVVSGSKKLPRVSATAAATTAKKAATPRAAATKTTATKAPAKKAAATRAPAKRTTGVAKKATTAKKTPSTTTAKKTTAKKTTAKRTPAKRTAKR
ncbi:HU family DNA-binding protein [Actinopolymorpha pittospori]|uniref:DNA-binding protein HU-beta n=1 Tax=Actinopolymorpha pittospori TaxID=648752 RepID=A0A927N3B4_9ACTN|nr:DNA-binding protein HU-beta [Actinopolymorpha pittospori]